MNIAGTGAFTRKFDSALYIMILLSVEIVLSLVFSLVFNYVTINGYTIEVIRFSWEPVLLLSRIVVILVSSTLCWIIRTNSMKYVDATVVAVMMPFSSVIAGILSILVGMDELTVDLVLGAILGFVATIICAFGDIVSDKKARERSG